MIFPMKVEKTYPQIHPFPMGTLCLSDVLPSLGEGQPPSAAYVSRTQVPVTGSMSYHSQMTAAVEQNPQSTALVISSSWWTDPSEKQFFCCLLSMSLPECGRTKVSEKVLLAKFPGKLPTCRKRV